MIFLFGNGFCQDNGALEALEKRVAKLEALLGNGFKGPFGKFSLSSSFDTIFYINRWFLKILFPGIQSASKGDKTYFKVTCQGPCQNIRVVLTNSGGDPDLCVKWV